MGRPAKTAFCPIMFGHNGGQFHPTLGTPIFERKRDLVLRGRCDKAYDCGTCEYMQQWVSYQMAQGWHIGWECVTCLKQTKTADETSGIERRLPGFYQEGRQDSVSSLKGCMRCGWESSVLQLVLRR